MEVDMEVELQSRMLTVGDRLTVQGIASVSYGYDEAAANFSIGLAARRAVAIGEAALAQNLKVIPGTQQVRVIVQVVGDVAPADDGG